MALGENCHTSTVCSTGGLSPRVSLIIPCCIYDIVQVFTNTGYQGSVTRENFIHSCFFGSSASNFVSRVPACPGTQQKTKTAILPIKVRAGRVSELWFGDRVFIHMSILSTWIWAYKKVYPSLTIDAKQGLVYCIQLCNRHCWDYAGGICKYNHQRGKKITVHRDMEMEILKGAGQKVS
jgi:hypothetical protein